MTFLLNKYRKKHENQMISCFYFDRFSSFFGFKGTIIVFCDRSTFISRLTGTIILFCDRSTLISRLMGTIIF